MHAGRVGLECHLLGLIHDVKAPVREGATLWFSFLCGQISDIGCGGRSVPLRDIRDVYYGFTSEVFRRHEAASPVQVKEWHCFSLQLPDRTLDFAAPTDQEAIAWTLCLRTLCYSQASSYACQGPPSNLNVGIHVT
jgi:hypothetical protein